MATHMTFTGRLPTPAVPNWAAHLGDEDDVGTEEAASGQEGEQRATPTREVFLQHDTSGDGRLNIDEVRAMIEGLGMPVDRLFLAGLFAKVDDDKTGYVEYGEFAQLFEDLQEENRRTVRRIGGTDPGRIEVRGHGEGAATDGLGLSTMLRPGLVASALAGRSLRDACRLGDMPTVRALLDGGQAGVNEGDAAREFETPLHLAAAEGHVNVIEALLAFGASPAATTSSGWTPLHRACLWGQVKAVAALLRGGADFRLVEVHGSTPRDIAMQYGHIECVQFLDSVGAADISGNVRTTTTFSITDPTKVALSSALGR